MTSLRVLHVVPHLDRVGGYERQALALARVQNRRPDTTAILLTHAAPGRPATETTEAGLVVRLPKGLRRHHPAGWWRAHGRAVDVVHAHALHKLSGQVVALAADAGVPAVVKVATGADVRMFAEPETWADALDGDERRPGGVRWCRMMRRAFVRLCRARLFLALNGEIEGELRSRGLPCARVDNGVDTLHFRPPAEAERASARRQLGLSADACVVAMVGRLAARKDQALVAEAVARLGRDHAALQLVLLGVGPQGEGLRARFGRHDLRGRAQLRAGDVPTRTVLHAADILAHPSRREGQPNVVLEAWACGLPTVLSDIPAHTDMLDPPREVARLAAPGDVDALVAALTPLVVDAAERARRGAAARAHANARFALSRVAHDLDGIYARLTSRATERPRGSAAN